MELEEMPIVIGIPEDAVKIVITATVLIDDELREVKKYFSLRDIRDLRTDFQKFIGDDWNALYVLTEEARREIEEGHL